MSVTIYVVSCKYSPGLHYFTTDFSQVQDELDLVKEEGGDEGEITYETRVISKREYQRMSKAAEGKEFPGW